jgi:hypothetical protein
MKNSISRAFLKAMGLQKNLSHEQIDKRLFSSLDDEGQIKLVEEVERRICHPGITDSLALYSIPKTLKQACLLFSHDYSRMEQSIDWIAQKVFFLKSKSIVEVGCSFGLLIKFLQTQDPNLRLMGIDYAHNLVSIGTDLTGINLIAGDYLEVNPTSSYDTVICNFGFDSDTFASPPAEHDTDGKIGEVGFCVGCFHYYKEGITPYIESWRKWGKQDSNLILTGRLTISPSLVLATLKAANEYNWNLDMSQTTVFKVTDRDSREVEKFPGLVFNSNNENKVSENFQEIMKGVD